MYRALVVLGLLAHGARPADACSCPLERPELWPHDAALDVPLNAVVIVKLRSYVPPNGLVVELHDVDGVARAFTVEPHMNWFLIRPQAALDAHTTYEVVARSGYLPARARFTTGDVVDTTPPAFDGLTAWSGETMPYPIEIDGGLCNNSCVSVDEGHVSRTRIELAAPPSDTTFLDYELVRTTDGAVVGDLALEDVGQRYLGFEGCTTRSPTLDPGERYCARIVAYDLAGNRSGQASEICGTVATCAPRGAGECEPADVCDPPDPVPDPPTIVVAPAIGGCATGGSSGGLVALVLALTWRWRRGR